MQKFAKFREQLMKFVQFCPNFLLPPYLSTSRGEMTPPPLQTRSLWRNGLSQVDLSGVLAEDIEGLAAMWPRLHKLMFLRHSRLKVSSRVLLLVFSLFHQMASSPSLQFRFSSFCLISSKLVHDENENSNSDI